MATKATTAKGVNLLVTKSGSTLTPFHEVKSVPEIGESAEKIDATSLESDMKVYVKDIPDFSSDLEFTMNAIPTGDDDSNYDLIQSLDKDATYTWTIIYPQQGVQCTISGQFTWRMGGGEVSTIQDIILTVIPQSAPTWTEYTATQSVSYEVPA